MSKCPVVDAISPVSAFERDPDADSAVEVVVVTEEERGAAVMFSTVVGENEPIVGNMLSEYVDVRDMVTEMGGAVVTTRESGGSSSPSTSSGLKIVMDPLQLETSWASRENTWFTLAANPEPSDKTARTV